MSPRALGCQPIVLPGSGRGRQCQTGVAVGSQVGRSWALLAARVEVSWPLPLPWAGRGALGTPGAALVWGSSAAPSLAHIHLHRLSACPLREPQAEKEVAGQGGITGRRAGDWDRGQEVGMGIGGGKQGKMMNAGEI